MNFSEVFVDFIGSKYSEILIIVLKYKTITIDLLGCHLYC